MSEITEKVREKVVLICAEYKRKYDYDFYDDHIKYVVNNAISLAEEYDANKEIVELGALLHDIAQPLEIGESEEHHINGAKVAGDLLKEFNYPLDKTKRVQSCILNHRGSTDYPRNSIEEECIADADVIAHFDRVPSLFALVYKSKNMSIKDGALYVKNKLDRDYNKLSEKTKAKLKDRYLNIIDVLFVN